jgi:excisionase family DNA binding protein
MTDRTPRPLIRTPVVLVTPRVSALLSPWIDALQRDLRRDGGVLDAELAETLAAIANLGRAERARRQRSDCGTFGIPTSDDSAMLQPMLSVAQVAKRLRVSERAVTARIARGSLAAHRVGGRWLIDPAALEEER